MEVISLRQIALQEKTCPSLQVLGVEENMLRGMVVKVKRLVEA